MHDVEFQKDGSEKIYRLLFEKAGEKHRALLADEVGLGKTITASKVIEKYVKEHPDKTIRVGYICRNLSLTNENIQKIKNGISRPVINHSRERFSLSLLEMAQENENNADNSEIHVYGLSPSTSIKLKTDGTKEERAIIYYITKKTWDEKNVDPNYRDALQGNVKDESWRNTKNQIKKVSDELCKSIIDSTDKSEEQKELIYKCIGKSLYHLSSKSESNEQNENLYIYYMVSRVFEKYLSKLREQTKNMEALKGIVDENDTELLKKIREFLEKNKPTNYLFFDGEEENKEIENIHTILSDTICKNTAYLDKYNNYVNDDGKEYKIKESFKRIKRFVISYLSIKNRKILKKFYDGYCCRGFCVPLITLRIMEELSKCVEKYDNDVAIDAEEKKNLEAVLSETYKDYIRLIRKYMILESFKKIRMTMIIADEIQNYSDIIEKLGNSEGNMTENDWVISEIIDGKKCPVLLMSATPFRYSTKMDRSNRNKWADSMYKEDESADNGEKIINNNAKKNLQEEFKMITRYLLPDKTDEEFNTWYENWQRYEDTKKNCMDTLSFEEYKNAVAEQTKMLKEANISRTERCMVGKNKDMKLFHTENLFITDGYDDNDKSIYKVAVRELERQPVTESISEQELWDEFYIVGNQDTLEDSDIIVACKRQNNKLEVKPLSRQSLDYWQDSFGYKMIHFEEFEALEEFGKDDDETKSILECEAIYSMNYNHYDSLKGMLNSMCKENEKKNAAKKFMKNTPAPFSFSKDYNLWGFKDDNSNSTISGERLQERKKIFASGREDPKDEEGLLYNARVKKLFDVVFEKEELHKLLFIPPAHPSKELEGVFEGKEGISKRLFFSGYKMTPKSLSVILSHEAERRNFEALKEKLKDTDDFKLAVLPDGSNKYELYRKDEKLDFRHDKEQIIGVLVEYAMKKGDCSGQEFEYMKSYYRYMTKDYSLTVLIAYAYDKDKDKSLYDVIKKYSEWGCIHDVIDEYRELADDAYFSKLIQALNVNAREVEFGEQNNKLDKKWKPTIAWGHFSGDKTQNESLAKTFSNKLARFNTPFLPFMFITTSIGGEGFDFDRYCRKIVHWTLEHNPLKFEQREGRINRYRSYAIRLILSEYLKNNEKLAKKWNWKDAFDVLQNSGDEIINNSHGIAPHFVLTAEMIENSEKLFDNYGLVRECYYYPGSSEARNFSDVLTALGYYRALLGHQTDDTYEDKLKKFIDEAQKNDKTFDINQYFITLYPSEK